LTTPVPRQLEPVGSIRHIGFLTGEIERLEDLAAGATSPATP